MDKKDAVPHTGKKSEKWKRYSYIVVLQFTCNTIQYRISYTVTVVFFLTNYIVQDNKHEFSSIFSQVTV